MNQHQPIFGMPSNRSGLKMSEAELTCEALLLNDAETRELAQRWGKLESDLVQHHNWASLSTKEQLNLPEASELHGIDSRLEALHNEWVDLLTKLPPMIATTRGALMLKFEVLKVLLTPDALPEVNVIFESALRDLARLRC